MNAYEKNGVFHCDCGFSWLRGESGNHNCADGLREKVKQLAAENVALKRVPETDSVAMLLALDSFRSEPLPDVGLQKALESLMYHRMTPATDRFVAWIKADGVDIIRNALIKFVEDEVGPNDVVPGLIRGAEVCVSLADSLREGAK